VLMNTFKDLPTRRTFARHGRPGEWVCNGMIVCVYENVILCIIVFLNPELISKFLSKYCSDSFSSNMSVFSRTVNLYW
jgi:hypothetical protein